MKIVLFALVKDGTVLVEKRPVKGFVNDQYLFPGGAVEDSNFETLEQTLIREMREELGVTPLKFELLTDEDLPGLNENILKPFVVSSWSGEIPQIVLDKEDPFPLYWMEINKLLQNTIPEIKKVVQMLIEHQI